jgi:Zn-dependent protease
MLAVGRFFGVPIYFAPSWLVITALLTFTYGRVISDSVPRASQSSAYAIALVFACAFALCVLLHELGHTAVALRLGTPVERVVIFLLGGVSEIGREPRRPREEFLIAAAGPAVSVVLAVVFGAGYYYGLDPHTLPGVLIGLLAWSNVLVAIFNLLPALPLDGGRLLRAGVWASTKNQALGTRVGAWTGRLLAIAVAIFGLLLSRASGFVVGLFFLVLAVYLWAGATQTLRYADVQQRAPLVDLERLLRPGLLVSADTSVAESLRRAWESNVRGLVVVDAADQPQAIVDEARIGAVPEDRRPWTPVNSVARPLEPGMLLRRGMDGQTLVEAVRQTPAAEYLVVNEDGTPAGILSASDLVAVLTATRHRPRGARG